ncbi:hypothetical protein J7I93_10745 [Bacillus sp. ISL-47]|uniref:hypothetical protein n=1 Tax=Bacillus sp. ISL-47 TaxID=2819130 RepID=UPI001BEB049F|nr:hypothetical protein [Bacillus sp. ISL-47]MBT2688664.1 hypothetical protein [Bacillus sp. ISL-47]MBT2710650.1 hypothetical protein [Pseudomonas sp. ISL-84]
MKKLFLYAALVGASAGVYFLYERQLGAIAFFLLSFYFTWLAYKQMDQPLKGRKRNRVD